MLQINVNDSEIRRQPFEKRQMHIKTEVSEKQSITICTKKWYEDFSTLQEKEKLSLATLCIMHIAFKHFTNFFYFH